MKKRPHIIIFNPDEMRWDTMSHMGRNPAAQTPHLDAFVQTDAVSFQNAYCQNPVCVPSRCSFFTGLYPHVHGHRTMQYLLHEGESSLFSELKDAGYYVWMNSRNDLVEGQTKGLVESHATEIYYGEDRQPQMPVADPAFRGEPGGKNYYSHYEGRLTVDENGRTHTSDEYVVQAAIDRIHNRVDDRPLCMFLGLMYPHTPYAVEEPYFSNIDRSKLPPRAQKGEGKPLMETKLHELMGLETYTEADWDELRACNLYGKAGQEEKILDMRLAMLDWYQATCDIVPRQGDCRQTDRMMWASIKPNCPPELEDAVKEMIRDGKGMAAISAQMAELKKKLS